MLFYTAIVAYLILITFFVRKCKTNYDFGEGLTFFSIFYFLISGLIIVVAGTSIEQEYKRVEYSCSIYSLSSKDVLSGNFSLGSGYVNSEEVYFYFGKDVRGGYTREWVYSRNAFIFERNDVQPQVRWQRVYYKVPKWIVPWEIINRVSDTKYDFYVPVGTAIQRFEVR